MILISNIIERLEEFQNWMPSSDKIFGTLWIISWILAIWVYHLQFFLTGLFCLVMGIILISNSKDKEDEKIRLPAAFSMDVNNRTLEVQKIYENDYKWEDNEVCSGDAILPAGTAKVGDVITNCNGNVAIRHIPTNKILGAFNFIENKEGNKS